jgi:hypothetical protein
LNRAKIPASKTGQKVYRRELIASFAAHKRDITASRDELNLAREAGGGDGEGVGHIVSPYVRRYCLVSVCTPLKAMQHEKRTPMQL